MLSYSQDIDENKVGAPGIKLAKERLFDANALLGSHRADIEVARVRLLVVCIVVGVDRRLFDSREGISPLQTGHDVCLDSKTPRTQTKQRKKQNEEEEMRIWEGSPCALSTSRPPSTYRRIVTRSNIMCVGHNPAQPAILHEKGLDDVPLFLLPHHFPLLPQCFPHIVKIPAVASPP